MPRITLDQQFPAGTVVHIIPRDRDHEPEPPQPPLAALIVATGSTDAWSVTTIDGVPDWTGRVGQAAQFVAGGVYRFSTGKWWALGQLSTGEWKRVACHTL